MKTIAILAFGLAVVAAPLAAQYQTIDSVNHRNSGNLYFSGVLVGQSTSTSDLFNNSGSVDIVQACERDALLMITHPGRFLLNVSYATGCTLTPAPAPTPAKTN